MKNTYLDTKYWLNGIKNRVLDEFRLYNSDGNIKTMLSRNIIGKYSN